MGILVNKNHFLSIITGSLILVKFLKMPSKNHASSTTAKHSESTRFLKTSCQRTL